MQTGNGRRTNRKLFGFRRYDLQNDAEWLRFSPNQAVIDPNTGRPPTFADVDDLEARRGAIGPGGVLLTREQAWSTWFWLLVRHAYYVGSRDAHDGQKEMFPWSTDELSLIYRGSNLVKKGF